jgi:hypothetical protein
MGTAMFWDSLEKKKQKSQERLDWKLVLAICHSKIDEVKQLLAVGANVHTDHDVPFHWAAVGGDVEMMKVLLEAGADVHQRGDWALRVAQNRGCTEQLQVVRDAIKKQDAQREKERLELERQRNPLRAGTGLTFAESRPEDMEILLRDAMAEQEQMLCPSRAGAPGREYAPLPQP